MLHVFRRNYNSIIYMCTVCGRGHCHCNYCCSFLEIVSYKNNKNKLLKLYYSKTIGQVKRKVSTTKMVKNQLHEVCKLYMY